MKECTGVTEEGASEQSEEKAARAYKHTNLLMCFAVTVGEKIKHGTRSHVTLLAPVISSVVVFKGIRGRGRGAGRRSFRGCA